ncbi:MAG: hypothetical protein ABSG13_05065 [Bryobacteraceae bacterium]|jgi:hypothetical protein
MKAIPVSSETEFERLLEHISIEAHRASDFWRLLKELDAAIDDHLVELNHSPVFWAFTFRALGDEALFHINRLYDKTAGVLSVANFLLTVKSNAVYFSEESFRLRMQGRAHLGSLAPSYRTLNFSAIDEEISLVSDSNPVVRRLHDLRNRYLSHRDASLVRLANFSSVTGLTPLEIDSLVERATDLVIKYGLIYRASSMSTQVVGADDFKHLLHLLKLGLGTLLAKRDEEFGELRAQRSTD